MLHFQITGLKPLPAQHLTKQGFWISLCDQFTQTFKQACDLQQDPRSRYEQKNRCERIIKRQRKLREEFLAAQAKQEMAEQSQARLREAAMRRFAVVEGQNNLSLRNLLN